MSSTSDSVPDGVLYYIARGPEHLRRLSFVGGNQGTHRLGDGDPTQRPRPRSKSRSDASGSSDPNDDALTFDWELGDGGNSSSALTNHTYSQGVYEAVVTVDDGQGGVDSAPPIRIVSGNVGPSPTLASPTAGTHYDAGQVISYSGTGTDPEEGSPSLLVVLCGGSCFTRRATRIPRSAPSRDTAAGSSRSPTVGVTSPDVWYRIYLTVSDSGVPLGLEGALSETATVDVLPNLATLVLETAPVTDLSFWSSMGNPVTAPASEQSVVNMTRELGTGGPQAAPERPHVSVGLLVGRRQRDAHNFHADRGCDVHGHLRLRRDRRSAPAAAAAPSERRSDARMGPRLRSLPDLGPREVPGLHRRNERTHDPARRVALGPRAGTLLGTSDGASFTYTPGPADRFFLVVAVGTDGLDGRVGHYGS